MEDEQTAYRNDMWSRDWTFFIEDSASRLSMEIHWKPKFMDLLMWTTTRADNRTVVWLQTKATVTADYVRRFFPRAEWCGSTTGAEEFRAWTRPTQRSAERPRFFGKYINREEEEIEAGRTFLDDLLLLYDKEEEALDALEERIQEGLYDDDILIDALSDED